MSNILERCAERGVPTGSRIICDKTTRKTDYDFVMTTRDFYRAFTDDEIDVFERGVTFDNLSSGKTTSSSAGVRIKRTSTPGFKASFPKVSATLDIIIVDDLKEKELWRQTTDICRAIHKVYSLDSKIRRIAMFEKIMQQVKEYS